MNVIGRNNVKVLGQGQTPMIFAHGFGCNQNMWRKVVPAFAEDHQIILFDHVGAGGSDTASYNRAKYNSLQGYANDVIEICEQLDLEQAIFVGHSVSAMIGALAANKRPELFSKLIMIGPSPCYMDDGDYRGGFSREAIQELLRSLESNFEGWSKTMAPVIMGRPDDVALAEELVVSFCTTRPEIAKHFAQVTFTSDNRADLAKVSVSSLILQCANDVIAPEFVGEYVHRQIKSSSYQLMKAQGHCPHLSAPEETIHKIKMFLADKLARAV